MELTALHAIRKGYIERNITRDGLETTIELVYPTAVPTPTGNVGDITPVDPVTRRWTCRTLLAQKYIAEYWKVIPLLAKNRSWLPRIIAEVTRYQQSLLDKDAPEPPEPDWMKAEIRDGTLLAVARQVRDHLFRNLDSFEEEYYLLQKTETLTDTSELAMVHENSRSVFTKSTLLRVEPSLRQANLLDFEGIDDSIVWLKLRPDLDETSKGQYLLTQQYQGANAYDEFYFGKPL